MNQLTQIHKKHSKISHHIKYVLIYKEKKKKEAGTFQFSSSIIEVCQIMIANLFNILNPILCLNPEFNKLTNHLCQI